MPPTRTDADYQGGRGSTRTPSTTAQFSPLAPAGQSRHEQSTAFCDTYPYFQMFTRAEEWRAGASRRDRTILLRSILEHPFHLSRLEDGDPRGHVAMAAGCAPISTRALLDHLLLHHLLTRNESHKKNFDTEIELIEMRRKPFCRFLSGGSRVSPSPDTATPTTFLLLDTITIVSPRPSTPRTSSARAAGRFASPLTKSRPCGGPPCRGLWPWRVHRTNFGGTLNHPGEVSSR